MKRPASKSPMVKAKPAGTGRLGRRSRRKRGADGDPGDEARDALADGEVPGAEEAPGAGDEPPPRPKRKGKKKAAKAIVAPPQAAEPEPWLTCESKEWYTPLMVAREGDVIECRGECRFNSRHFLATVRGTSFTVRGVSGCFLEASFDKLVKGSGAATLGSILTGPGGQGLLRLGAQPT